MRLTNSIALATIVVAAALSGCTGVDVHSQAVRGVAYVRVDDVVKHHPLYPQLSKIEDGIAAINLEAAGPHVPRSAQEIADQTKVLDRELKEAQDRANAAIAKKQQAYQQQEQAAINAAMGNAGNASGGNAASAIAQQSQQSARDAYDAANRDMAQYQQSVVAQDQAASNAIIKQLNQEANQKLQARAAQYQQEETDLQLQQTRQDSAQRLALKTKLNNLAMDEATQKDLQTQLNAIDKKENDQLTALRKQHQQQLAAYNAQLSADTQAKVKEQVGAIQAQTRSKLQAHSAEVGQQIRSLSAPTVAQNVPPDLQKKLQAIQSQFATKFQADAQAEVAKYNETKADLDRQFAELHGQDVGATGAAAKELKSLQDQHDKLYQQITDQIQREASRIAKDRGFSVVFDNVAAASGGYDLTNDLISDVESLHE